MTTPTTERNDPPIYDALVNERGDVVAEVRATAERLQREIAQVLNWSRSRYEPVPGAKGLPF